MKIYGNLYPTNGLNSEPFKWVDHTVVLDFSIIQFLFERTYYILSDQESLDAVINITRLISLILTLSGYQSDTSSFVPEKRRLFPVIAISAVSQPKGVDYN